MVTTVMDMHHAVVVPQERGDVFYGNIVVTVTIH